MRSNVISRIKKKNFKKLFMTILFEEKTRGALMRHYSFIH